MNILVVHETEYLEKVIFEYQIIPEIWASRGHKVYVLDFPNKWRRHHPLDFGSPRPEYLFKVKKANKRRGVTLIHPAMIKLPILDRVSASISYFFLIPHLIKRYKIEVIYLLSVPTNGLQTVFWARRLRVPIYFRLLDVLHQLVPNRLLSWPTYLMEKIVYRRVDELTAVTPKLTQYAIRLGAKHYSATFLPTGSDADLFFPQKKDQNLLKKYGLRRGDQIILFAGTFYSFSGLDQLLRYFSKVKRRYPRLKFLLVGRGEQEKLLRQLIEKHQLESCVILTGFVDYRELPRYINLADICINPFQRNKITDIIFPSKIYQYRACGKPVIATPLRGTLEIFPDNKGKNGVYYFSLRHPQEFFSLLEKIPRRTLKDTNPSLQQIAEQLQKQLAQLAEEARAS